MIEYGDSALSHQFQDGSWDLSPRVWAHIPVIPPLWQSPHGCGDHLFIVKNGVNNIRISINMKKGFSPRGES